MFLCRPICSPDPEDLELEASRKFKHYNNVYSEPGSSSHVSVNCYQVMQFYHLLVNPFIPLTHLTILVDLEQIGRVRTLAQIKD